MMEFSLEYQSASSTSAAASAAASVARNRKVPSTCAPLKGQRSIEFFFVFVVFVRPYSKKYLVFYHGKIR